MYKKFIMMTTLLCTAQQYASDLQSWLEIKPSYFLFSAAPMKDVYNHGGFEIQGSGSMPICRYLDLYGSIGYRTAQGHALNGDQQTRLTVIPVDIGLKPIFNLGQHGYYFFAAGPRYFACYQRNKTSYVDGIVDDAGVGFFINTGFNVELTDSFLLGIFTEYSYEKKMISSNRPNVLSNGKVQMGGFAFGLTFNYAF